MNWTTYLLIFASIVVVVSIVLYFFQERFLFHPEKLHKNFQFQYENQKVKEYNLKIKDGVTINGLHFKAENSKGLVYYLKGNSKSIKGWGKFAVDFTLHNYDVIMIDYRGFGKSTGKMSQESMKHDALYVYNKLKEVVKEENIIIYGRSLGTGLATKVASMNNPKMLVLACPYFSMKKNVKRYLPFVPLGLVMRYSMPTYKWIKYVKCPIKIIHGTNDKVIKFASSIRLSKMKPNQTKLFPIIGGGHKDLHNFESYHKVLHEILTPKEELEIDREKTSIDFIRTKKSKKK
ncbi:alpha/beta hydrolase [Polaribacter sp. Hel1_85]|uniref:alpha/beta hydrolase n=1 Tax=Polaribacter sp. Hel1_85 TaxID=1250005 RepID=UPI00052C8646|nr:alpha/beta fold hydrolase [Polaribacter sp. Hel1_85]KGL58806.1 alpha/beta hydrolase-family protein [Polaribacter sp. Hel1_85]